MLWLLYVTLKRIFIFRRKRKMKKSRRAKNRLLKRAKKKAAKKWRKRNPTLNCWRIPLEYSLHRCIVILQNLPRNKSCLNTIKFNLISLFVWIRPKPSGNFVFCHVSPQSGSAALSTFALLIPQSRIVSDCYLLNVSLRLLLSVCYRAFVSCCITFPALGAGFT